MHQHPLLLHALRYKISALLDVLQQVRLDSVFNRYLLVGVFIWILDFELLAHDQNVRNIHELKHFGVVGGVTVAQEKLWQDLAEAGVVRLLLDH